MSILTVKLLYVYTNKKGLKYGVSGIGKKGQAYERVALLPVPFCKVYGFK